MAEQGIEFQAFSPGALWETNTRIVYVSGSIQEVLDALSTFMINAKRLISYTESGGNAVAVFDRIA